MDLRVIYVYDGEADAWGFRIPSLGVVGSGATRTKAEEQARAAILFTLEVDTVSRWKSILWTYYREKRLDTST